MKLIPDRREDVLRKSIKRARERDIILPTFAQMKDPKRVPEAIKARLRQIGLWDMDPANPIPQRVGDVSPIKYVF